MSKKNSAIFDGKVDGITYKSEETFFDWAVCCPISDHVMILLRILPSNFPNSCMSMNK